MRALIVIVVVLGLIALFTAWPLINDVETGRTPQYPDLQPRVYTASPDAVSKAVQAAIGALPRWTFVGAGHGPGGHEIQATHATRVFGFVDEVTIRIRRESGKTRLSARSKSRVGSIDFGQNARNIRELLAEVDRRVEAK